MNPYLSIACFVTAHGFGHAARASAVMEAVFAEWPYVRFEIFTRVPEWFFRQSLSAPFDYHPVQTDIGLVQTSPFASDLGKTLGALDAFMPFADDMLDDLGETLHRANCRMIICDISPLGIAAGKQAGITTVLVENFTWDWIYEDYRVADRRLESHIRYLRRLYAAADHLIQAAPVCAPKTGALSVPPVSRNPRHQPAMTRARLSVPPEKKAVLVTAGGVPGAPRFMQRIRRYGRGVHFIVAGDFPDAPAQGLAEEGLTLLPRKSDFYHPDLVAAVDAVVGKIGYGTLAEVYHAGVPFGYVPRPDFRETAALCQFAQTRLPGVEIPVESYHSGEWLKRLPELLALPPAVPDGQNGAAAAADHICRILGREQDILEIVDHDGRVIGAAPRKQVHGNCEWLHRVVHVLVFDDQDRLLLQKRSMSKQVAPGRWDTSVGGHVDCGETVKDALVREMAEELGIRPPALEFAYRYIHANAFESELVHTYICRYNGAVTFNPEEIDAVKFWEAGEIRSVMGKGILSDNFEDEYQRYRKWAGSKSG